MEAAVKCSKAYQWIRDESGLNKGVLNPAMFVAAKSHLEISSSLLHNAEFTSKSCLSMQFSCCSWRTFCFISVHEACASCFMLLMTCCLACIHVTDLAHTVAHQPR